MVKDSVKFLVDTMIKQVDKEVVNTNNTNEKDSVTTLEILRRKSLSEKSEECLC